MKKVLSKVGQSTLEYVIVLVAIVAAIIFAAAQFIKPATNKVFSDASATMNASGTLFTNAVGGGLNITATGAGTTSGTTASTSGTGFWTT
jgi:uncharacterized protein (UPF0333 family)